MLRALSFLKYGVSIDGLIQRLQITVWPDDIGSWKWTDRHPDAAARERYDAAFRGLHDFARGFETPAIFGFSSTAKDMFRELTEIQTEARSGKLPSVLESHLLKMPKTVAALALIFELVDGGRGAIGSVAAARALDWADYLKSHAARLYSAGSVMAETARASLSSAGPNCRHASRLGMSIKKHGRGLPIETPSRRRSNR